MTSNTIVPVTTDDLSARERVAVQRLRTWKRFHYCVRRKGASLLSALPEYHDCVLIAGCQRSGTTMLTRVIAGAANFRKFSLTHDDELDAALALAGYVTLPKRQRYCFQTTYLNERFQEYQTLGRDQKLIWVIRNPYSVVYSLSYHWKRFAREELYQSCIADQPELSNLRRCRPWQLRLARVERACIAYRGKTAQIHAIQSLVGQEKLLVVDYDDLVLQRDVIFPKIFKFIGERFQLQYIQSVRPDSLNKAQRLSTRERALVERIAEPIYGQCRALAIVPPSAAPIAPETKADRVQID